MALAHKPFLFLWVMVLLDPGPGLCHCPNPLATIYVILTGDTHATSGVQP